MQDFPLPLIASCVHNRKQHPFLEEVGGLECHSVAERVLARSLARSLARGANTVHHWPVRLRSCLHASMPARHACWAYPSSRGGSQASTHPWRHSKHANCPANQSSASAIVLALDSLFLKVRRSIGKAKILFTNVEDHSRRFLSVCASMSHSAVRTVLRWKSKRSGLARPTV